MPAPPRIEGNAPPPGLVILALSLAGWWIIAAAMMRLAGIVSP